MGKLKKVAKILCLASLPIIFVVSLAYSAQCLGITKKGTQCKRQAAVGSVYCWQHGGKYSKVSSELKLATVHVSTKTADSISKSDDKSSRCQAITLKGAQCKRRATSGSKFCWQHGGASSEASERKNTSTDSELHKTSIGTASTQCQAITKKGTQCKRKAKLGSHYCWQHGG